MTDPKALQRQISDTLNTWLQESFQLYDKAGIPEKAAGDAIASLFVCLISGLQSLGIDPIEAGQTLADGLRHDYDFQAGKSKFKH